MDKYIFEPNSNVRCCSNVFIIDFEIVFAHRKLGYWIKIFVADFAHALQIVTFSFILQIVKEKNWQNDRMPLDLSSLPDKQYLFRGISFHKIPPTQVLTFVLIKVVFDSEVVWTLNFYLCAFVSRPLGVTLAFRRDLEIVARTLQSHLLKKSLMKIFCAVNVADDIARILIFQ